jgi:hypothetical protein
MSPIEARTAVDRLLSEAAKVPALEARLAHAHKLLARAGVSVPTRPGEPWRPVHLAPGVDLAAELAESRENDEPTPARWPMPFPPTMAEVSAGDAVPGEPDALPPRVEARLSAIEAGLRDLAHLCASFPPLPAGWWWCANASTADGRWLSRAPSGDWRTGGPGAPPPSDHASPAEAIDALCKAAGAQDPSASNEDE